ncbi:MAG: hypothetical protein WC919_07690 [Candidatus Paceibacterota bacterium]|jgi:hypothetical protein
MILMFLNCDGGDVSLLILRIKYRPSLQRSTRIASTQNSIKYDEICSRRAGVLSKPSQSQKKSF